MEIPLKKEELSQVAEEMAQGCREFIIKWRPTNKAAKELPRDPLFAHMADKLMGFLEALWMTGMLNAEEVKQILRIGFPTFIEGSELPPAMPSIFADFVKGMESLDDLGKEGT